MCGVGGAAEGHGVWGCRAGASQYEIGCVEQASTPGPFIGLDSVTRGFHLQGVKPHVSSSASMVRARISPAAASARALTGCSQGVRGAGSHLRPDRGGWVRPTWCWGVHCSGLLGPGPCSFLIRMEAALCS